MNTLDIDAQRIEAGFDQLAAETAPPIETPSAPAAPAARVDWTIASAGLVGIASKFIAPNWDLTDAEQSALTEQLGAVLKAFFPAVDVDPRYQAVGALVLTVGSIAVTRYDAEHGRMRPLRRPPPPSEAETARNPTADPYARLNR